MSKKIIDEVFNEIKKRNIKICLDSIPHSDEFINYIAGSLGIGIEFTKQVIQILINSHKLFSIEIVSEDEIRNIPKVEGYIETNLNTIRELKSYFQNELMIMYETEFNKKLLPYQVIKAIFPIINSLNNTQIGKVANKAIMLGELERLLEKDYEEYTEVWKKNQLEIELNKETLNNEIQKGESENGNDVGDKIVEHRDELKSERAVDSEQYEDFISKSKCYPIDRIIRIYGVEFFFRANLRKYKFSYMKRLIEETNLLNRSDLLLLRNMLQKVKLNIDKDPNLSEYSDDLYALERSITHKLYFKKSYIRKSKLGQNH